MPLPVPNKPTLIIGLGGVGSRIVEGIYHRFDSRNPSDIDRRNVEFLCLDTDEKDVEERKKVMPSNSVVKTSSDLSDTIGGYIDRIKSKTTVLDWFDTKSNELLSMPLNKGAAQVRMASRLATISAISEGKLDAIDNSITRLMALEPERHTGNIVYVYIVCSLAGGTGAGSFLQTAYYVKNSMIQHGANAPEVTGYFLLADVLCDDASKGLSDAQKNNMRSNTYACMKELLAFSSSDRDKGLKKIEFEYRLGQKSKSLPTQIPYNSCYLIDYSASQGENLMFEERYEEQVASFIFLDAFSPVGGEHRSKSINDMRQMLTYDGMNRFKSLGVSKLVYPVDDLFAYFARQRVTDNMGTTWCQIDKDFEERYQEYKKNIHDGIPDEEPKKGHFFMTKLEELSRTEGAQGAEFRQIYRSTQVLNKDLIPLHGKGQDYVKAVENYVKKTVSQNKELNSLYSDCSQPNPNFTARDVENNDIGHVMKREGELEDFRRTCLAYIDNAKQVTIKQCFIADHDNVDNGYVTKDPDHNQHHLNTFILEKENEMHPLAVRYFLYEVQSLFRTKLAKIRTENAKTLKSIDGYKTAFDNPETKDRIETALDSIKGARQGNKGAKKALNLLSGQNPYKAAKEEYERLSLQQAENIKKYASDKLFEETLSGLLVHVNSLLEESENFFNNLPAALEEIDNVRKALLKKHDSVSQKDVSFVLASEHIKKDIYGFVISRNDSPFFPTKMSASLYRSMYHNVAKELDSEKFKTSKQVDKKAKKKAVIEANKAIIEDCIVFQEEIIRESNSDYANKNVIAALKEEAMRECGNDAEQAKTYMVEKFKNFREKARIWGPGNFDKEVRYINAWGYNPDCVGFDTITQDEVDELFGDIQVDITQSNAALRLESEFFSPYEIVRANTANLLTVDKYFVKFIEKEKSVLTDEHLGVYHTAYMEVIDSMNKPKSKEYSPHLDKHWHLPAFMPNIGSTAVDENKKLLKALAFGLLFDLFEAIYDSGEYYWKFKGVKGGTSRWIRDIDRRRIGIAQTQEAALNSLFERGLANNPDIVEAIIADLEDPEEGEWKTAADKWLDTEHDETNDLAKMKDLEIVKKMYDFKYNIYKSFVKNKHWFTFLEARKGSALYNTIEQDDALLRDEFIIYIIEKLIFVFGQSVNTKKVCKHVLSKMPAKYQDDVDKLIEEFEDQGRFEPIDNA